MLSHKKLNNNTKIVSIPKLFLCVPHNICCIIEFLFEGDTTTTVAQIPAACGAAGVNWPEPALDL